MRDWLLFARCSAVTTRTRTFVWRISSPTFGSTVAFWGWPTSARLDAIQWEASAPQVSTSRPEPATSAAAGSSGSTAVAVCWARRHDKWTSRRRVLRRWYVALTWLVESAKADMLLIPSWAYFSTTLYDTPNHDLRMGAGGDGRWGAG